MQIAASPPPLGDELDHHYEYRVNHSFSPGEDRKSRLIAAIIPCVTGIGWLYQVVVTRHDQRVHPPPGRMVDIDGCQLHVQTTGRGQPSVVLETGLGGKRPSSAALYPMIGPVSAGAGRTQLQRRPHWLRGGCAVSFSTPKSRLLTCSSVTPWEAS